MRTLDKQQETYKQSIQKLVKQDLVISAYKPNGGLIERFKIKAGSEEAVWDFIQFHLRQLPAAVVKEGRMERILERMAYLLYDRMVAFHVQHGILVPLSAAEFYSGLDQRFPRRDEMYFLPDQVNEYDRARLQAQQVEQLQLFVSDEASAILWLRQQLEDFPQTYQEIFPKFLKELSAWDKHEKALELAEMLEQNFLCCDEQGPLPAQIVRWLQQQPQGRDEYAGANWESPSPALRAAARDRWYTPDPNRAQDLERLREKTLLKEFESYRALPGRQLKIFRAEAVRAGFKKAWQEKAYPVIIEVAEKLPEEALQEDAKLMMWYDQALTRLGRSA